MRSNRLLVAIGAALVLSILVVPAVGAKEFDTIYADGEAYRTFGNRARVDPGTGTDPIIAFTNFEQGGVAKFAPGAGSHGGRWQVWLATWTDPGEAFLVTDFEQALELAAMDRLTIERAEGADFRCPILPARGNGHD